MRVRLSSLCSRLLRLYNFAEETVAHRADQDALHLVRNVAEHLVGAGQFGSRVDNIVRVDDHVAGLDQMRKDAGGDEEEQMEGESEYG